MFLSYILVTFFISKLVIAILIFFICLQYKVNPYSFFVCVHGDKVTLDQLYNKNSFLYYVRWDGTIFLTFYQSWAQATSVATIWQIFDCHITTKYCGENQERAKFFIFYIRSITELKNANKWSHAYCLALHRIFCEMGWCFGSAPDFWDIGRGFISDKKELWL